MNEHETPHVTPEPSGHVLEMRDLFFAALNGLFIGIFAPFIFRNIGTALPVSLPLFALILTVICVLGITVGYFLSRLSSKLGFFFQLAKFGLIGTANFVVDLGIFSLFIWMTGVTEGSFIILFKVISVSIAIINSYIWNKFWSFEEKRTDEAVVRRQFLQFIGVSVAGLTLNTATTYSLINFAGDMTSIAPATWATLSSAVASILVLSWNFVGYKFFVFKR